MARRNQFSVNAESVQGNAGAEITFRSMKVREMNEYRTTDLTDEGVLMDHVLAWTGIVDDSGVGLPNPKDEPGAIGELYLHEQQAIVRLLFRGPDGADAKN